MKTRLAASIIAAGCAALAHAQAPTAPASDAFLDKLAGHWVADGRVGKSTTVHDIDVQWVLAHQYLLVHETSREKTDKGNPRYEAYVWIAVDRASGEYTVWWLDSTTGDGLTLEGLGKGRREGDAIPFTWRDKAGALSFTNRFEYDEKSNRWTWTLANVKDGKSTPFATFALAPATGQRPNGAAR